ncbi:MAG: xylulokinase [Desulfovibrio sp.]|nr:MAG: xylulokinase [Desulfovibrio sp.]
MFIGMDSGTQGTKALALCGRTGRVLAEAYAGHDLIEGDGGRKEQDPAWWIVACTQVLGEVCAELGADKAKVRGIGVSGQQHGFVPLDAEGQVIRPAKLWCDTETAKQCEVITERAGGPDNVVSLIGNTVAAGFTASKILWLKDNEPANFDRLALALLPHDYINYWLTGEAKAECGDASGTAYFDVANRKWSKELVQAVDPSGKLWDCLPPLIESHEAVGVIRPELAEEFGLPKDLLVSSGGGDNMMAAIGTGNVSPGVVTASLGTSGTIYANAAQPVIDPQGELAAFCSSDGAWLPLVCTMNVTVATELAKDLFSFSTQELNDAAGRSGLGAGGVTLLPYFNGERTPALPQATATLHGLTTTNYTPDNLCRAAMEGATLGLKYGLDVMARLGVSASEIRLVGGGAKSPLWRSLVADIFNCPVVRPGQAEAGALGGALQAMWCVLSQQGGDVALKELTDQYVSLDPKGGAEPDSNNASQYAGIYESYLALDQALRSVNQ